MKKVVVRKRDAVNAMREFVNEASTLTYCGGTKKARIAIKKEDGFATRVYWISANSDLPKHTIYYNFDDLKHQVSKIFRSSWSAVDSTILGFADVTLALLHELGHLHTHDEIVLSGYTLKDRTENYNQIMATAKNLEEANQRYYLMKDEMTASLWMIEWLKDAEHRKMAKAFEKKFFACCE